MTSAFVMEPADLRRVHDVLVDHIGPVALSAKCADNLERHFASVDELCEYDNLASRALVTLRFWARDARRELSAALRLGMDPERNIAVSIEGPEDVVLRLGERVDELLASMRPIYWRAAPLSTLWVLFPAFLLLTSTPWLRQLLGSQASAYAVSFIGGALVAGMGFWLDRRKNRLFPSGVFAIGHGAKRQRKLEVVRTVVVVGFIVSFAATVVGALLF